MIGAASIPLMLQCVVHADGGFVGSPYVPVSFEIRDADFAAFGHADLSGLIDKETRRVEGGAIFLMARYRNLPATRVEVFVAPAFKGVRQITWSQLDARGVNGQISLENMVSGTCEDAGAMKGMLQ